MAFPEPVGGCHAAASRGKRHPSLVCDKTCCRPEILASGNRLSSSTQMIWPSCSRLSQNVLDLQPELLGKAKQKHFGGAPGTASTHHHCLGPNVSRRAKGDASLPRTHGKYVMKRGPESGSSSILVWTQPFPGLKLPGPEQISWADLGMAAATPAWLAPWACS